MKKPKKATNKTKDPLAGDLSHLFDRKDWIKINFELLSKNKTITLRLNEVLLNAIKVKAELEGIDYQKWIRDALEQKLNKPDVA